MDLLTIIFPYRNRKPENLKNSFESLKSQTITNFKAFLVDYGSKPEIAAEIRELCLQYPFLEYKYYYTQFQPWNKSRALNSVIKNLKTDFCFVADVDIIFHPKFVETAASLMTIPRTTYFQVGYLNAVDSQKDLQFHEFSNYRLSNYEATGLSLFPVKQLQELRGFDEFYHFWGAEDTDMHVRLKNAGHQVQFYDKDLLLLHQWHTSYQSRESSKVSDELQVSGVLPLNHQHLKNTIKNGLTKVNIDGWGENLSEEEFDELTEAELFMQVTNEMREVQDVLYGQLPLFKEGVLKIKFIQDPFENSLKYKLKRFLGMKVSKYYSLKEVNDLILLHLISFYRDKPYTFKVSDDLQKVEVAIKF